MPHVVITFPCWADGKQMPVSGDPVEVSPGAKAALVRMGYATPAPDPDPKAAPVEPKDPKRQSTKPSPNSP